MKEKIPEVLSQIESENNVKIIYACESGSRAWGFASKDSDYDVRFLYVHARDWYLSIAEKGDVIEIPVDEVLDVNGWDIRKALQLLRNSNAPLLEWLVSPIVYQCEEAAVEPLRALSKKAFLPLASFHHYLSMSENSLAKIRDTGTPRIKSYLYTLRPMLCCKRLRTFGTQPPMVIDKLMNAFLSDPAEEIRRHVDDIIRMKKESLELTSIVRLSAFEDYLMNQLAELSQYPPKKADKETMEHFDGFFRELLNMFW